MTLSEKELFAILADGLSHSGQEIANAMGVSRTAIWKALQRIRAKGVEISSVRGKGYCLQGRVELLDENRIAGYLGDPARLDLQTLEVHYQVKSTNSYLHDRQMQRSVHANVVLAEYQTGGVGRGRNVWLSGLASGLCLSIGWHFDSPPESLGALSLATAVMIARSVKQLGGDIRLKWPNDLVYSNAKLGGILIESRGQLAGEVDVIVGIGINIRMPESVAVRINQNVTDLSTVLGYVPSRNRFAGIIIDNMFRLLRSYADDGFAAYVDEWRALDSGRGKAAVLNLSGDKINGQVLDIDESGYLVMSVNGRREKYSAGDLTLRIVN